jgi:hypothetical protein
MSVPPCWQSDRHGNVEAITGFILAERMGIVYWRRRCRSGW